MRDLGKTQEGLGVRHLSASFFLSFPQTQILDQEESHLTPFLLPFIFKMTWNFLFKILFLN